MLQTLARRLLALTSATHLWRILWLVLLVAVGYLTLTPQPPAAIDLGWDKLNHLAAFAALALCGCYSLAPSVRQRAAMVLGLLAYGGGIELLQLHIPGRSGEWADWLADAMGISAGMALSLLAVRALGLLAGGGRQGK